MSIIKSVKIILTIAILLSLCKCGGRQPYDVVDSRQELPTDTLISRGSAMIRTGQPDSAIMCYTIVTERYENGYEYDKAVSPQQAVNAYTNLGFIFSNQTLDYHRAYDYTLRALQICQQDSHADTLQHLLPYIYLNLGVINGAYADSRLNTDTLGSECEANIEKAFYASREVEEWRPFLISYYNLSDILLQAEDTVKLRQVTKVFRHTDIPELATPLLDYCRNLEKIVTLWLDGDYASVIHHAKIMENNLATNEPSAENFRYMARYMGIRAIESMGDTIMADSLLNSLATDIDASPYDNAKLWVFKIMVHRFENRDPETSRQWQLKYYITHEHIDSEASLTSTDNISFISEMRDIRASMKADRESARRARTMLLFVVLVAVFIIASLLAFILWQRRVNHYRRTIVNKQLAIIGADKDEVSTDDIAPDDDSCPKHDPSYTTDTDSGVLSQLQERIKNVLGDISVVCRPDFSLTTLCEIVESNTTYVSRAIRLAYGKPFSVIVNEIRVAEACRRFADPDAEKYTVEAVGQELGFRSRSNFTAVFKKITGLSPSEFKKFAK